MCDLNFSRSNQHMDQTWDKISCCLHEISETYCGAEYRVPANTTATQIWPRWWKLQRLLLLAMEPWSRKICMMHQRGLGKADASSTSCTGWFSQMQLAGFVVISGKTMPSFLIRWKQRETKGKTTLAYVKSRRRRRSSFFQRNRERWMWGLLLCTSNLGAQFFLEKPRGGGLSYVG